MTTVCFYTLGCKSNQYETDRMIRAAEAEGCEIVPYPAKADIYVINTCTVTSNAAKKSRNAIRHSKKLNPQAKVIFTGCDSELEQIIEADLILKNNDKKDIAAHLRSLTSDLPSVPNPKLQVTEARVRANLMIEDGCENFCSYCIVPFVRGRVRARPMAEVLDEANEMAANGVKEIILTGINLGEFTMEPETERLGSFCHSERSEESAIKGRPFISFRETHRNREVHSLVPPLISLINELSKIDGLLRIRLSSIEPMYITDELIKCIKENSKVCKHLHIPMQSGDDGILKAMNRTYTSGEFANLIMKTKKQIKEIAVTTDIIIGFPGEDEKAFKNTCRMVNKLQFSRIHIFSYSDRPRTAASRLSNKVDPKIIAKRHAVLGALRDKYMLKFHRSFRRKPVNVLIEQKDRKTGLYKGLTGNYIRVFVTGDGTDDDSIGRLVPCKFKDFRGEHVFASAVLL